MVRNFMTVVIGGMIIIVYVLAINVCYPFHASFEPRIYYELCRVIEVVFKRNYSTLEKLTSHSYPTNT